jgi:hypothetical protein
MSGKSELSIFDDVSPQVVIDSAIFQDVHPQTALDSNSDVIDFYIAGSNTEYLDLNDTLLSLRLHICRADGKAFTATDVTRPVPSNYFLNALFSDVSLSLNDTQIEGGHTMYPYKATIESALNFNDEAKRLQFLPAGVSEEDDERAKWVGDSDEFELVGALRLDFLSQPKYLIPGVSVRVTLTRSKDVFSLHLAKGIADPGNLAFKIVISQCILYVRRVKVHPSVEEGHKVGLIKNNAVYPYTRTKIISYSIPKGSTTFFKENLFSNALLPKFIVVAMVHGNAFTGSLGQKPFDFQHFNANTIALYRDGQGIPYKRAYNPHFRKGKTSFLTDVYVRSILQNTQLLNTNHSNGIDLADFSTGGYGFYTFNLTPDFDMNQTQQVRDANLRLEMRFSSALTDSINVIAYAIFDAKIQITNDRAIICDAH